MIYRVLFTKEAKEDIKDIYEYIAYALLEPTIAKLFGFLSARC